jgi:hypothetical protein
MKGFFTAIFLIALLIGGCTTPTPVHTEQGLAKRITETAIVEGTYEVDAQGEWVNTKWGRIPIQRANRNARIARGDYVWATGKVERGRIVNGKFVPSSPDFRGMRAAHDLTLRGAKIERHAPPASQPTSLPFMGAP